jgi:uncharacterized protein YbjT (DUF2867 family)
MILVLGATGTIGSATVQALKAKGARFKVGVRSPEKAKALGVEAVAFDWDNFDSYLPAFKGAEKLFLLTPISDRQLGYVQQAMAAAKRAGVKHAVKLSVIGADVEPGISLGRQHLAAEKELKASGLAWTMLRPGFFMQNMVNYYGANPKQDGQVYLPHGQSKTAWVDGRDVGEVAAETLTGKGHESKVYDMTGPEALSTAEALTLLGEALGRKYTYVDVPEEAAKKAMEEMKMPLWMVDGMLELHALNKHGYATGVADGVKKALGREPRTFRQWAKDFAAEVK